MNETNFQCKAHSGFKKAIENLETQQAEQWKAMEKQNDRINGIYTRMNIILGSLVVACIMMGINLFLK